MGHEKISGRYVLGKMDGTGNGKRNCEAAFTYEVRAGGEFSMSGEVWNPRHTDHIQGGQCIEEILTHFPDDARARQMAEVWRRWHLNHMHAGCEHQRALGWGHGKDVALSATDLTPAQAEALHKLAEAKAERLRPDVVSAVLGTLCTSPRERQSFRQAHDMPAGEDSEIEQAARAVKAGRNFFRDPGLQRKVQGWADAAAALAHPVMPFRGAIYKDSLGAPCPVCGYCYGSTWLKEDLPADVVQTVRSWAAAATPEQRAGEDEGRTLAEVLAGLGIEFEAVSVDCNPHMDDTRGDMTHWRCIYSHPDGRTFQAFFSMGSGHNGRTPEPVEVLDCVLQDDTRGQQDFEGWCADLGFDPDSRRALHTFNVCHDQAAALSDFLGADVYQEMQEGV